MNVINITNARQTLFKLISDVDMNSEPVTIINNKGSNAVLISENDWKALQETIYLLSIPGMRESIIEGGQEKLENCKSIDEIDW